VKERVSWGHSTVTVSNGGKLSTTEDTEDTEEKSSPRRKGGKEDDGRIDADGLRSRPSYRVKRIADTSQFPSGMRLVSAILFTR
jgi:hypothetical protein